MSGGLQRCYLVVEIVRKAKALLEVSMATHVTTNMEGGQQHQKGQQQQKERENMAPLLKWAGSPVTKDTEVLDVFFTFLITELALSNRRDQWENPGQSTFTNSGGWSGQGIYI